MARAALSLAFSGISGTLGDLVVERRPGGTVVRPPRIEPPLMTPGRQASARRMALLSLAWHALDEESFAAWRALAEDSAVRNSATGAWVVPNPYNLFCKYAGKVRQVDPEASLEGFRPAGSPFGGDSLELTVDDFRLTISEDSSLIVDGQSSMLRFSADRANADGVVTELLSQPLVNARRRVYRDRYVSRGFVAFEGPETAEVPCESGAWACAYRFVRPATGQETAIFELGVVTVGA